MRVKRFQAKDMPEAMKMVKAELGANAIILHSRDMNKGLLGFLLGGGVEVTAAVDDRANQKAAANPAQTPIKPKPQSAAGRQVDFCVGEDEPRSAQPSAHQGKAPTLPSANAAPINEENPLLSLSKQLEEERKDKLRKLVEDAARANANLSLPEESKPRNANHFTSKQDTPDNLNAPLVERLNSLEDQLKKLTGMLEHLAPSVASGGTPSVPSRTREVYNHLLEHDVDEQLALNLAVSIAETADESDDVWTALKLQLMGKIPTSPTLELDFDGKRPKVIMLVGPTGVGKTTTLAKISAQYRYNTKAKVRPRIVFVTADLFRLAAVEQLQKYAEILGVELESIYSPDEAKQALNKHKDSHLILFDTAGACQRNLPQINTLSAIREAAQPDEVHLVLSSTTKFADLIDVVEHFKEIKPNRFLFTKIDESTTYGSLFNTTVKYKIPLSYLTTGQNVPEDIEGARPEKIAKLLLTKPTVNRSIMMNDNQTQTDTPTTGSSTATPPKEDAAPRKPSRHRKRPKGGSR